MINYVKLLLWSLDYKKKKRTKKKKLDKYAGNEKAGSAESAEEQFSSGVTR